MKKVNGTKDSTPQFHEVEMELRSGVPLPERLFCLDKDDSIVAKAISDCTLTEIIKTPMVTQALIDELSGERNRAIELRESIFKISQETPKTSH